MRKEELVLASLDITNSKFEFLRLSVINEVRNADLV